MTSAVRLLQVSDCHLSADSEADYRGQSPDRNLGRFADAVRAFAPDWLILTGDLSEDGSEASYRRLCQWLTQFEMNVAWLPGNHDDRSTMAPIFDAHGFAAGPVIKTGNWQLALLDSAWPSRPEGELDEARLSVLDELEPDQAAGVFVHHHPLPVSKWIDRVKLEHAERFWQKLERLPSLKFVAFGHVHQRFRSWHRHTEVTTVECLAAPSTAANSVPGTEKFIAEPGGPMARWFVLDADAQYRSGYLGLVD